MKSLEKISYSDIGALTEEAQSISKKSRSIIAEAVGGNSPEDRVRQRCIIATGDISVGELIRFKNNPVDAGFRALDNCREIYVDIKMVEAGIVKKGHRSKVTSLLGRGDDLTRELGITRTSAAVLASKDLLNGSIVVIGNAPSSLISLCKVIEEGIKPALVIGTPVGFVNAANSKDMLRELEVPSISNVGTRGGTPIAVAAMNEIINMYYEKSNH